MSSRFASLIDLLLFFTTPLRLLSTAYLSPATESRGYELMQAGLRTRFQKEAEGNSAILIAGIRTSLASRKKGSIHQRVRNWCGNACSRPLLTHPTRYSVVTLPYGLAPLLAVNHRKKNRDCAQQNTALRSLSSQKHARSGRQENKNGRCSPKRSERSTGLQCQVSDQIEDRSLLYLVFSAFSSAQ